MERVLRLVDRADFIPAPSSSSSSVFTPYADRALPVGSLATITAPHAHCVALQELRFAAAPLIGGADTASRILDVGSGSGYLTTCLALLFPSATVYGVEHSAALVAASVASVSVRHAALLQSRLRFHCSDGMGGLPAHAPYDAIHVGAAADRITVSTLRSQLRPGGVLLAPELIDGTRQQKLRLYTRSSGADDDQCEDVMDCQYAPLRATAPDADVDSIGQWERDTQLLSASVERLKAEVQQWHAAFKRAHSRSPSSLDRSQDPQLQSSLDAFHTQSRELERRRRVLERLERGGGAK